MTATEAYESITNGGTTDFAAAVQILERNRPWCLIGGLAINCYVEPVYTVDADIVVVSEHLQIIEEDLSAAGFTVRELPLSLNAERGAGRLNIQFTTHPRYQGFINKAAPATVLGLWVRVARLEDLVQGTIWAWSDRNRPLGKRKKDELDLIRLAEAYPDLRPMIPAAINSQFDA